MTDHAKEIAGLLKDSPDWVKLLGVLVIVWVVDRYGSMATDVEAIKNDISVMKTSVLTVQSRLDNHEGRIGSIETNQRASQKTIEALESMTDTIWRRLDNQDDPRE